jgi:hypothetical protein
MRIPYIESISHCPHLSDHRGEPVMNRLHWMTTGTTIVLGLLVLPCLGLAGQTIPPPGDDLLGIYVFPTDSTMYANVDVPPPFPGLVNAHLCLTRCSAPDGIAGWECAIEVSPGPFVSYFVSEGINVATPPDFAVGMSFPQPPGPIMQLCTLSIFMYNANPVQIWLHPVSQSPTIPGQMVYVRGYHINEFIHMHWSSGNENLPVFGLNTGPMQHADGRTIEIESSTWGRVKQMYR